MKRQAPPGRRSNSWKVLVKPAGPHHRARRSGSLNASNTRSRGASMTRVVTISRSEAASAGTASGFVEQPDEVVLTGAEEIVDDERRRLGAGVVEMQHAHVSRLVEGVTRAQFTRGLPFDLKEDHTLGHVADGRTRMQME